MEFKQIRKAKTSDIARIAEIGVAAFSQAFITKKNKVDVISFLNKTYDYKRLKNDIEEGKQYYLCEEKEKVIGFILVTTNAPSDLKDNCLKIDRLYLDPLTIGKGFGRMLMSFVENIAILSKMDYLWLEVLRTNDRGVNFYKKLGFTVFDRAPAKFIVDEEIDLWMKKDLK